MTVTTEKTWVPYADGTSGHQGGASKDAEPDRRRRISQAVSYVRSRGLEGATYFEYGDTYGLGHGAASGALSNAQRSGLLLRTKRRRGKCEVYVAPEFFREQDGLSPYRRNRRSSLPSRDAVDRVIESWLDDVSAKNSDLIDRLFDLFGE